MESTTTTTTTTTDVKIDVEEKPEDTTKGDEVDEKEKEAEESTKLLSEEETVPKEKDPSSSSPTREISAALSRTALFAQKLKSISVEKPPTRNPLGYIGAVFGLCFAGAAVGLGICCCVGAFLLFEIIPIAAIVMGATYWDRNRYCTAENIPLLLIIGGVLKVIHLTLSTAAGRDQSNARKVVEKMVVAGERKKDKKQGDDDVEANNDDDVTKNDDNSKDEKKTEEVTENPEYEKHSSVSKSEPEVASAPPHEEGNAWFRLGNALLTVAELTWFITATVIIYGMYETVQYSRVENVTMDNYCHQTLYRFAFWYITFFYVLLGLVIIVPLSLCCCGCLALLVSSD